MWATAYNALYDDSLVDVAVEHVVRPVQGVDDTHASHDPDLERVVAAVQEGSRFVLGVMNGSRYIRNHSSRPKTRQAGDPLHVRTAKAVSRGDSLMGGVQAAASSINRSRT